MACGGSDRPRAARSGRTRSRSGCGCRSPPSRSSRRAASRPAAAASAAAPATRPRPGAGAAARNTRPPRTSRARPWPAARRNRSARPHPPRRSRRARAAGPDPQVCVLEQRRGLDAVSDEVRRKGLAGIRRIAVGDHQLARARQQLRPAGGDQRVDVLQRRVPARAAGAGTSRPRAGRARRQDRQLPGGGSGRTGAWITAPWRSGRSAPHRAGPSPPWHASAPPRSRAEGWRAVQRETARVRRRGCPAGRRAWGCCSARA